MFTPYWKLSAKWSITHRALESIKKHISAFSMWKFRTYSDKSFKMPRTWCTTFERLSKPKRACFPRDGSTCIHHPNQNYCNFIIKYTSWKSFLTTVTSIILDRSHTNLHTRFPHCCGRILRQPHKKHLRNLGIWRGAPQGEVSLPVPRVNPCCFLAIVIDEIYFPVVIPCEIPSVG